MKKLFVFIVSAIIAVSLAYAPVASADAGAGEKVFKNSKKKCKACHKATGDPTKFRPVGPGLKGLGKRLSKEYLMKWLSPENKALFEANGPEIQDLKARYKAAKKKDLVVKKSQMIKNFGSKGGKKPKIQLTDTERADLVDYLLTL